MLQNATAEHESTTDSPSVQAAERARTLSAKVRSRSVELLQKLGEKKREKEERSRQLEERLRRRQALLRDRLLQKTVESRVAAEIGQTKADRVTLPPRLPAADNFLFPGALQPCLEDVKSAPPRKELRKQGQPQRASSWHSQRSMPTLKRNSTFVLDPLPPKPGSVTAGGHSSDGPEECSGKAGDCASLGEVLVCSKPNVASTGVASLITNPKPTAAAASRGPCTDMASWKRRNGYPPDAKVFICSGGYFDFRDAMLARGWVENPDKESPFFDIIWGMASDIKYDNLQAHQVVNHFYRNREITTKVGLTLNLRSSSAYNGVDLDAYYPRAFDLHDPLDRADFVLDYKLTHAESILRAFTTHIRDGLAITYSKEVIEIAVDILRRRMVDIDDLIDQPGKLTEHAFKVTNREWLVLQRVNLDDPSVPLDNASDSKTLEAAIQKSATRRLSKAKEAKDTAASAPATKGKKKRSKKKQSKDALDPSAVAISANASDYTNGQQVHLIEDAQKVLEQLAEQNPQSAINGTRNAWIIKPAGKSRGRGIQMLRDLTEIFKATESDEFQWICQKYIEQPELPFGYKFDIRQWVLVTDWNPLTVYVWRQPYIRFAGEKYDASLEDKNQFMHLVNNSIVKYIDGFSEINEDLGTAGLMWFRQQYEDWLHKTYCKRSNCKHCVHFLTAPPYTCETFGVKQEDCFYIAKHDSDDEDEGTGAAPAENTRRKDRYEPPEQPRLGQQRRERSRAVPPAAPAGSEPCRDMWETCVKPQINDIVLWSLRTVMETVENRKNSVEMFGYDFMLSAGEKEPKVWLIEVNSSPAMDYSTHVTTPLVKKVMEDSAKVLVDRREDPLADTGEWELLRHDGERQAVHRPVLSGKLEVVGKAIQPPKRAKKKKKKKKRAKAEGAAASNATTEPAAADDAALLVAAELGADVAQDSECEESADDQEHGSDQDSDQGSEDGSLPASGVEDDDDKEDERDGESDSEGEAEGLPTE